MSLSLLQGINPWLALLIAGALEIAWASGFKYVSPQRPLISLMVGLAMVTSFYFLWLATQKLPVGTAYAVWTGIGAAGAAIIGMLIFKEPMTAVRILSLVAIIGGVVGLKLGSGH
ncbi:MAG: DMT family transporter [Asticcacaulis sp.]